jgi:hypothetical protein
MINQNTKTCFATQMQTFIKRFTNYSKFYLQAYANANVNVGIL